MSIRFEYSGVEPALAERYLLNKSVEDAHREAISTARCGSTTDDWTVEIPKDLIFDRSGLELIGASLAEYDGDAQTLSLVLKTDEHCWRDYYTLQDPKLTHDQKLTLGVSATRERGSGEGTLEVILDSVDFPMPFPTSFLPACDVGVPKALLTRYHCSHDMLIANWIAFGVALEREVRSSPWSWVKGVFSRRSGLTLSQRMSYSFSSIHPSASVHPTAVIEGSIVGAGARIGAHTVVRYSVIGENARLHDGAKVELSVVGDDSWLMHDLVLYRSVTEPDVFLIHGPYQFSYFQRSSSAFATIMMDWRPGDKPIRVMTCSGLLEYGGPLLGAVLEEGAKTLGGSLLAPGRVVPKDCWLGPDPGSIHAPAGGGLETNRALSPGESKKES